MLLAVQEFCRRVGSNLEGLINELQTLTGRRGEEERWAWRSSLSRAAHVLDDARLADFHLHVGQRGGLSLEYRLPASSSWCDMVLLGRGEQRPAAVIIELKDWQTFDDQPGPTEGLIRHKGNLELHPSEQVRGYAEYCKRFHSAVLDDGADVTGCVYFSQPGDVRPYTAPPHDRLTREFPIFLERPLAPATGFLDFLTTRLKRPDMDFAERFEKGFYRQDRSFCLQMAAQIADRTASPFVLLDHQRRGLELALASVKTALSGDGSDAQRHVVIIEGPPGSGKSVVAGRLWAELARGMENIVITTTTSAQRRNWKHLFRQIDHGASWFVMPASQYQPADPRWVNRYRKSHGDATMRPETWRENIKLCQAEKGELGPSRTPLVSIVDEARALINPESPTARTPAGYAVAFGPQAYHIVRGSRVAIFLLDAQQGFRDRENTTAADIETWAREQGAVVAPVVSLAGAQFRAGGSVEYMDWVDHLLGFRPEPPAGPWRRTAATPTAPLVFDVVPDPTALDEALQPHFEAGQRVRLLAAYGRAWVTKGAGAPHELPAERKDFDISFCRNDQPVRWSRIWNYVPQEDYTQFVQGPTGSRMAIEPLAEVGCPYVVRGFDYDWTGVLWLSDLVWRGDRWRVNLEHVHESGIDSTLAAARREAKARTEGPAHAELVRRVQQAYRIILSRAMRGLYVWFEDEETRDHVLGLLD